MILANIYDTNVKLASTDSEWDVEIRLFFENYELTCVAAWDGFRFKVSSKLKSYYGFLKKYPVSYLRLVSCNKRFLYAAAGASGSAHDARLLKSASIYSDIINGLVDILCSLNHKTKIPLKKSRKMHMVC